MTPRWLNQRSRYISGLILVLLTGITIVWAQSGPRMVGSLSREDSAVIRLLLKRNDLPRLWLALRTANTDALADWILEHRGGRVVRLEVQGTNRVLAFLTSSTPQNGCLLVIDRATTGWRISETNNSVRFK